MSGTADMHAAQGEPRADATRSIGEAHGNCGCDGDGWAVALDRASYRPPGSEQALVISPCGCSAGLAIARGRGPQASGTTFLPAVA